MLGSSKFLLNRVIKTVNAPNLLSEPFSVLQWNTLNPNLSVKEKFQMASDKALDWTPRKEMFITEIPKFNADFICLEEVAGEDVDFYKKLAPSDFEAIYQEKLNKLDGLLLMYNKKNSFTFMLLQGV